MKKNQNGFSIVEVLIVIVVVGLLGVVGWLVYDRQKNKTDNKQTATQAREQKQETLKEGTEKTAPYSFKELGISMEVLDGWEVKTNHTNEEGVNFYNWTVEKANADGKIRLSSVGFRGGFHGCTEIGDPLTAATVKEVASTQNSNLMFMAWSYSYDNQTHNNTGIVRASDTVFRTTNNGSTTAIANKDVKAGNYFFCSSLPLPGFSLSLNNEEAPTFSRRDSISALASRSSGTEYITLPANAQSYGEIKSMLITIK